MIEKKPSQDLAMLQNGLHQKEIEITSLSHKLAQNEKRTATITQNLATLTQHSKEDSAAKNQQLRTMGDEVLQLKKALKEKEDELATVNQEGIKIKETQSRDRDLTDTLQIKEQKIAALGEHFQQRETETCYINR